MSHKILKISPNITSYLKENESQKKDMSYTSKKKEELLKLCRERDITRYSNKKKDELISMLESYEKDPSKFQTLGKRSKAKAKSNEAKDLNFIVEAIKSNSNAGQKIKKAFFDQFGKELQGARKIESAGSNSTHFDLEIMVDQVWYTVEHKGSKQCKPIDQTKPPWTQGVQFYNGIAGKYTIGKRYAQVWYNTNIATGHLSKKYGILSEIPKYTEWYEKDALSHGDPKTSFGLELRSKFRGGDKKGGCFDERDEMTRTFYISEEELEKVKEEVLTIAKDALKQKKYWLQIQGDLSGEFHCSWHPGLLLTNISKIEKDLTCSDVQFKCECDMGFNFKARLRWGKGQGFSNLRIDLR